MNAGATLLFRMPPGRTLREAVTTVVQEWLPPFRAEPAVKAARWVVQAVMEGSGEGGTSLWEPGISTAEYESRVDQSILRWAIRATAGRGKGTILARFATDRDQPGVVQLIESGNSLPETLFDPEKVEAFLRSQGEAGADGLFATLLAQHGFQRIQ